MSDYLEKLKDPRWQKKRLEIFQRDNWSCKSCGNKDKPLHIHHLFYFKDKEPWEVEDGFLLTLCEECHSNEKEPDEDCNIREGIIQDIGTLLNIIWKSGYDHFDIIEIANSIGNCVRPLGPAWKGKFIAQGWKWNDKYGKWVKPKKCHE